MKDIQMNRGAVALSLVVSLLSGCGMDRIVAADDLDWKPSRLTMENCPELNGEYIYKIIPYYHKGDFRGFTSNWVDFSALEVSTGSANYNLAEEFHRNTRDSKDVLEKKTSRDVVEIEIKVKKETAENKSDYGLVHIKQTTENILLTRNGRPQVFVKLGTNMAGCSEGILILRHLKHYGGGDFTPRVVRYGEYELKKNYDGSLTVTLKSRDRTISFASGLLTNSKEHPVVTQTYPLAPKR